MSTIFAIPGIALTLHGFHFTSSGYISTIQSFSYPKLPPVTMNGCPLGEASCLERILVLDSKMQENGKLSLPLSYVFVSTCYPLRLQKPDEAKYGRALNRTHISAFIESKCTTDFLWVTNCFPSFSLSLTGGWSKPLTALSIIS